MTRIERNFKAGTAVRIDALGWPCHGKVGTVERDTLNPGSPVGVILATGKVAHTASYELARLRSQPDPRAALADALARKNDYQWGGK